MTGGRKRDEREMSSLVPCDRVVGMEGGWLVTLVPKLAAPLLKVLADLLPLATGGKGVGEDAARASGTAPVLVKLAGNVR
jgi:hypothetical protein